MVSRLNIIAGLSITFGWNGVKVVVPKCFRDPLKQVDAEQHVKWSSTTIQSEHKEKAK
jgi:hypothetical protein